MTRAFLTLLTALTLHAETFRLDHFEKVFRVTEPRFSPDGKRVAFVVARPNYSENTWESDLYVCDLETRKTVQLTWRKTVLLARWSPAGGSIAFLSAVENKAQIFALNLAGGEARQITRSPTGVQRYSWKPDGSAFGFLAADEAPKLDKFDDSFEVGATDYLMQASPQPAHLWTISAAGTDLRRLTSGTWSVSGMKWSPDGAEIALETQTSAGSRDSFHDSAQRLPAGGGALAPIAELAERHCSLEGYSSDGRWIAGSCKVDGLWKNQLELFVAPSSGGPGHSVSRALDRNFNSSVWMGDSLLAIAADGTKSGLWTIPLSGAPRRWKLGNIVASNDLDVSPEGRVVITGMLPDRPPEVYVLDSPDSEPQRLTDIHAEVASLQLGKMESLSWKSDDSLPLSGVVTFPPDFDPTRKYPLLLVIHGGPWGSSAEVFRAQSQLLAARGWIIFEPNYRGSDNAGNALYSAVYRDHGAGPGRDVMSGLAILKKRPYIDATRIGVSGWSYGGYMTTWLIGHYDGWKAAMAGAAVIDLVDDYNLNDLELNRLAYGDTLSMPKDLELMREQSPMTYVDHMRTPLLMMSDTGDVRVPVTQSYKLLHALRERGQEAHLILYPVAGHMPADPYRARDIQRRWMEWFAERFGK